MTAWWKRLRCRWFGHQWEERNHYMRGMVVAIRRCARCRKIDGDRTHVASPKQYPLPRA